jgi:hypothetical protein
LLKQLQKIKLVPNLYDLPIPHPKLAHALKRDRLAGGFHAEGGTLVRHGDSATGDNEIIFGNRFLHGDVDIREGAAKAEKEFPEFFRPADRSASRVALGSLSPTAVHSGAIISSISSAWALFQTSSNRRSRIVTFSFAMAAPPWLP